MSDHYFITADQGHLRIYVVRTAPGQREAALDPVESMDFPAGVKGYTDRETAMAGRFQGSRNQAAAAGAPSHHLRPWTLRPLSRGVKAQY